MSASAHPLRHRSLGVLGGGQLGRYFVHSVQRLGWQAVVLEPQAHSPAGSVANEHIVAAYDDPQGWQTLAQRCCAVTTEFENVPAPALQWLADHVRVAPGHAAVAISQDRMAEKAFFRDCSLRTAPYLALTQAHFTSESHRSAWVQQAQAQNMFPAILKTARMGYDGKGQIRVAQADDLLAAWAELGGVDAVLEKRLVLLQEISVLVARDHHDHMVCWPVQRNHHHDGILAYTRVGFDEVSPAVARQAQEQAQRVAQRLNYEGVLCVEFFLVQEGQEVALVINEMAPRPHNSGHYSIDACDLSQFDAQARIVADLPLVVPQLLMPCVMLNVLGDAWGPQGQEPDWAGVLGWSGVHVHLYGKTDPKPGRKMGHITVMAAQRKEVLRLAQRVAQHLGLGGMAGLGDLAGA